MRSCPGRFLLPKHLGGASSARRMTMRSLTGIVALSRVVGFCAVAALFGWGVASEAHAGGSSLKSCAASLKAACGNVKPGSGRAQACFNSHLATLSEPCKTKLTQAASSARACEADVRKLCGGVERAADIPACMEPRLAEVGKTCKRAMARVAFQYSRGH